MSVSSIIAHRGAAADAPENTLAAFREAWAQGADAVECDVRQTKDGAIVLLHDITLLRTANLDRRMDEVTLAEAQRLDVGSWMAPRWSGERVPELRDLMRMIPADKRLTVEVKGGVVMVAALCAEMSHALASGWIAAEQVDVISFDFAVLQLFRMRLPEIRTMFLAGHYQDRPNPGIDDLIMLCRGTGMAGLSLQFRYLEDQAVIEKIHSAGLLCCTWTVNDEQVACELCRAGVDAVTTDRPGAIAKALREATGKARP